MPRAPRWKFSYSAWVRWQYFLAQLVEWWSLLCSELKYTILCFASTSFFSSLVIYVCPSVFMVYKKLVIDFYLLIFLLVLCNECQTWWNCYVLLLTFKFMFQFMLFMSSCKLDSVEVLRTQFSFLPSCVFLKVELSGVWGAGAQGGEPSDQCTAYSDPAEPVRCLPWDLHWNHQP